MVMEKNVSYTLEVEVLYKTKYFTTLETKSCFQCLTEETNYAQVFTEK